MKMLSESVKFRAKEKKAGKILLNTFVSPESFMSLPFLSLHTATGSVI